VGHVPPVRRAGHGAGGVVMRKILEHIDDSRHFDGKEEHDLIAKLVAAKAGAEKD
jgi:hypothetical protein